MWNMFKRNGKMKKVRCRYLMKRFLSVILSLMLCVSLFACDEKTGDKQNPTHVHSYSDATCNEAAKWVHANAANYGLKFRMSWEPWHIEPENVQTENVTYEDGKLTLDPGKTNGSAIFKIHYDGDLIGEYHVVVRSTWADVIVPTLKNEDGTFNSADNPEKYMNATKLDIADYENKDEFFKMLVFGGTYDEETKEYYSENQLLKRGEI